MKISVRWLNQYLEPGSAGPITAAEAEHALTFAGFPIESADPVSTGGVEDVCLDVEVTSNRGDVLSHIGVAREIAALTGRKLRLPAPAHVFDWSDTPAPPGPPSPVSAPKPSDVASLAAVDNRVPDTCRLFTLRAITGVKVGPSPAWLVDALRAVGQRSINNVVDITNFVALEYGQPSHVFDMRTIARNAAGKHELIVRTAAKGEKLALLDGRTITLAGDELVVADQQNGGRVTSLAGVMGGAETEVSDSTTDVLLEAATWDPVTVRRAARRFTIRTDASYRFERIVDPRTIDRAARRAAALIVRLAGGTLHTGVISAGPSAPASPAIRLRPARVNHMLGAEIPTRRVVEILNALDVEIAEAAADAVELRCTPPAHRPDLTREIDLIEEVARIHGLDNLPVGEKVAVRVASPQPAELAMRELSRILTGLGYYEAVTFTFVSPKAAKPFVAKDLQTIAVCDERRKADPILRPSPLPSLLACRRANQDAGVTGDGPAGIRLYETSAVFGQLPPASKTSRGKELENRNLALLIDAAFPESAKPVERKQAAIRAIRGTLEAAVHALGGASAASKLDFAPFDGPPPVEAYDPAASGVVRLDGHVLGTFGLISDAVQRSYDLAIPVAAAEVNLPALLALYPPRALVHALPQFPSIERDLSLIVAESVAWAQMHALVAKSRASGDLPLMDDFWFVTTYRGQPVPAGKKSLTFRMRFRDPADQRTLRHEEVDPQVAALVTRAKSDLAAELRA